MGGVTEKMNPEVKAKAEALADALAESKEYQEFVDARESLENHEAAKIMLRDFQSKQAALQQKVFSGQQPTEAEVNALQEAYRLVTFNPYVRRAVEAEAVFAQLLADVQKIIGEAVGIEMPDDEETLAEGGSAGAPGDAGPSPTQPGGLDDSGGSGRSRLWVPGR